MTQFNRLVLKEKIVQLASQIHADRKVRRATPKGQRMGTGWSSGWDEDQVRHALLAYGFLRGLPYKAMEKTCKMKPSVARIDGFIDLVVHVTRDQIEAWLQGQAVDLTQYLEVAA